MHTHINEPVRVYLSLGANLGDREATLLRALELLDDTPEIMLHLTSSLYMTEPVGYTDQPEFLNCAAALHTTLNADTLLDNIQSIEQQLGRMHRQKWHEREIDIDILLYGNRVIKTDRLSIPHPELANRGFVLYPLHQIAPDATHPVTGKTVRELLRSLSDTSSVRKYRDISRSNENRYAG